MKTRLLIIFTIGIIGFAAIPYSYASCAAPLFGPPGPCFDSFMVFSDAPLTEQSIMENYARNIEMNYGNWQMSDRNWIGGDAELELPAIICTEFVADGMKQYRMAKWVDSQTISSFENHRDDSLCDKWLAPIDDEIKVAWDKSNYLSNDVGIVRVTDMESNLDDQKIDSFDIHVWSDTDHDGIKLTITETGNASGIFESKVFFTTTEQSRGIRLLVEDAVYADHKSNVGSARIIDEHKTGNDIQAGEIKIPFGETISLDDLKITFYDIEDSRCPSDVTCVWEGKVRAMIRISNSTHDIGGPHSIGFVQESFSPYLITLKDIQPYPISTEKPDYVATLDIAKTSEFTDPQTCKVGNVLVDGTCMPKSESFSFEIWPTESVVRYPDFPTMEFALTPAPTGPFESFYLEEIDELAPEGNILVVYTIMTPDGIKQTSIGHFHLDDIASNLTKVSFGTTTAGEYAISGKIYWQAEGKLYSIVGNTTTVTAQNPMFRGLIEPVSIDESFVSSKPFDWNSDDVILFRYAIQHNPDETIEKLATMNPDGSNVTTLPIPALTEDNSFYDARFSPDGDYIHVYMDNRNLYRFDLKTEETTQLTHQEEIYDFDYYHYSEDNPELYSIVVSVENKETDYEDFILLDIGNGEKENSILDAHVLVFDFESHSFDISPDGKKILFKRTLDSQYPRAERVLAYLPAQGEIVEIPVFDADCGTPPKWSPNGEMIVYHSSACSRGPSGGTLHLISVDGNYDETLLPYTHNNPEDFIISPDGTQILYGIDTNVEHGFEKLILTKPIPEFSTIAMMILLVAALPVILLRKQLLIK